MTFSHVLFCSTNNQKRCKFSIFQRPFFASFWLYFLCGFFPNGTVWSTTASSETFWLSWKIKSACVNHKACAAVAAPHTVTGSLWSYGSAFSSSQHNTLNKQREKHTARTTTQNYRHQFLSPTLLCWAAGDKNVVLDPRSSLESCQQGESWALWLRLQADNKDSKLKLGDKFLPDCTSCDLWYY